MTVRTLVILLAAVPALAGCGTSNSVRNRTAAHERVNRLHAELEYDQAWQSYETGQFEKALQAIDRAIAQDAANAGYHVLRGRICMEVHRLERAAEAFEAAIRLDPKNADAHYFCGVVHQRWSDDARAYEHYAAAHEIDPAHVGYLLAAAESLVAQERYDEARELVEPRLDYFEHNPALRHLLGEIAMLRDDPQTAADLFSEAWRLDPEDTSLLEVLADAQLEAGKYEDCLRSVRELRRQSAEKRPDLIRAEARCLALMGRPEDAAGLYMELTRLDPDDVETWADLGAIAWQSGDFHRTALAASRLTALVPERYEGYLLKAVNERHHGNLREAVALLRESARRSPDEALPHLLLGRVLEEAGQPEEALRAYARALELEPDDRETHDLHRRLSRELLVAGPAAEDDTRDR